MNNKCNKDKLLSKSNLTDNPHKLAISLGVKGCEVVTIGCDVVIFEGF
jgi:hypothetical protein